MFLVEKSGFFRVLTITTILLTGTFSTLMAQCPEVEAVMIESCGADSENEFVIINSGSSGFNTSDITIDFPIGNNAFDPMNNDVNTNVDNTPPGTPCGLSLGNINSYTGCPNLIAIGPGFNVPPNQIVIFQTSIASFDSQYDFSSLCGSGQCVYVISNSCDRERGAFTNNTGSGIKITTFGFGPGCTQIVTYDTDLLSGGDGEYYLPLSNTYGNNGCVVPPSSPAPDPEEPDFTIEDEYCVGETPDNLPTTSDNGITGAWVSTSINTSSQGTANYVFTPTPGQCAEPFTLMVTVSPNTTPTFSFQTDYCQNESPDLLPGTSDNGVTGTWSPPVINTGMPGTINYTFTPDVGQCAVPVTIPVQVDPLIIPTFSINDQYCQGDTPDILPGTSGNGITGTWNPTTINTSNPGTINYVFTPNPGQCASNFTLSVAVDPEINPTFTIDVTYCVGETADVLPTTSNNGVQGTWSPTTINTSSGGSTNYTFTPLPSECASVFVLSVTVTNNVTPVFNPIGDLCQGATPPALPNVSNNGITGSWNPATINTSAPGMTTYTFTPGPGQCATPLPINVTILERPTGSIQGNVDICPGQCGDIGFNLDGGSGTYNLNMQISVGAFSLPFTIPGATFSTMLEICYNGSGFFPSFNPPATLIIPENAPPGTLTLNLLSMTDTGGGPCAQGIILNNTMSITLRDDAESFNASLTVCDEDNDGTGIFDLTDAEDVVTGNAPGATVTWYENSGLTMLISNPMMFAATNGTIVYALVTDAFGCESDSEVTLNLQIPDVPVLPAFTVCVTDPPLLLPVNIGGVTGVWSDGNGYVTANQFDPTGVPEGDYTITFTPDPGQCYIAGNATVTVTSGGPVPLNGIPAVVCLGSATLVLPDMPNGVTGIWSSASPHLSGNIFNVTAAGVGTYEFTFTPNDPNSCFLANSVFVDVIDNATLTPPVFPDVCENTGMFNLGNTVNGVSGTWGGSPFVSGNMFNTNSGDGSFSITFEPDDDCTEDLTIQFEVDAATNLTPLVFNNLCNTSPILPLPGMVSGISGVWTLNSVIVTSFNPMTSGNGTFSLVFTPNAGSCANGFTSNITVGSVSAGGDNSVALCINTDPLLDLTDYISPGGQSGGVWELSGNPVANPTAFDVTTLQDGPLVFNYILNDPTCGNDTAMITLNIQKQKNAGSDNVLSLCETQTMNVNFGALLGTFNTGGTWTNSRNLPVNYTNLTSVDVSSLPFGSTIFTYRFDAGICPGDTAELTLLIDEFREAGPDRTGNICINSTINLNTLITSGFSGGTFDDVNLYGNLNGSTWDASGQAEGMYTFLYHFPTNGLCPADTAIINIMIQSTISAGDDVSATYCDGAGFVASDFIPVNGAPGGKLFNGAFEVPFGQQILGNLAVYNMLYITGDGATCPFDTARITIQRIDRPNVVFILNNVRMCEDDCGDLTIRHNSSVPLDINVRLTNSGTFTNSLQLLPLQNEVLTFCNNNVLPLSFFNLPSSGTSTFVIESIVTGACTFTLTPFPVSNITVEPMPTVALSRTLCQGRSLTLGNTTFNAANPSGTVIVPGVGNQCDTTYNVNVSFYPEARGNFNYTGCDQNFSVTIGNQTFNRNNPGGTVTLPNASFFGCDSIVTVSIVINQAVQNRIEETTCDPAYTLTIGNSVFSRTRPSGMVTLNGQAANGCDSIITVNLTFINPVTVNIDTMVCSADFSLSIGGTTFNASNPTGMVTLQGGAQNGCDSIINVNISFGNFLVGESITLPECGDSTGVISFQSADTAGPYELIINGMNEDVIPALPFDKELPPGEYLVSLVSPDGCQKDYSFTINDNSTPSITLDSTNLGNDVYRLELTGETAGIYDISWSPSSIFSCDDCLVTIASPLEGTQVTLEYLYGEDCVETLTFRLNKAVVGEFEFPNIIRPETAGNGIFFVVSPENFVGRILQMSVYDRWGNKVFNAENIELDDPSAGWDGRFDGGDVIPGVYVYVVEIIDLGSTKRSVFSGDLTVIR
ncbi:MAG: gliding motility-associated C-terminal domain-containing protein [Saprospiraceae bacterium]|nr:gliding motility-associated C-terminal domain-containing protein [Saprospiraceae bacterium]